MAIETAVRPCTPEVSSITVGLANSGKTARAIARAAGLAQAVDDPSRVVFLAASPSAAAAARDELARMGEKPARITVETPFALELEVLGCDSARAFVGRRNRVLTDFEFDVLMEDMCSQSIPTKNIKGMVGFLCRAWTEMMDDDMESFIIDHREQMAIDALGGYLRAYDALLRCEVAPQCVKYLRANAQAADRPRPTHIVVDDYQSLNRASQLMLELLEPDELHVYADPTAVQEASDPFPYPQGIEEFKARNATCSIVELDAPLGGAAAAAARLKTGGYLDTTSPETHESTGKFKDDVHYRVAVPEEPLEGIRVDVFGDPAEELAQVSSEIRTAIEEGCSPDDLLVVVPNRRWARAMCSALAKTGVRNEALAAKQPTRGDFRDLRACGEARMYEALALLADPEDPLAWRMWCGCGDHVAHAPAFKAIAARGCGVVEDLERGVGAGGGTTGVHEAYHRGRQLIDALAGLRGEELLLELSRVLGLEGVPPTFAQGCALAGGADGARSLLCAVESLVHQAGFGRRSGAVRVCEVRALGGLKASRVYVTGLMNGWLPRHAYFDAAEAFYDKRRNMDKAGRQTMYLICSCAKEELVFSGFAGCELETAERLGLKGYRVSMGSDGRRRTTCRTSVFLDYALHVWGHTPVNAVAGI